MKFIIALLAIVLLAGISLSGCALFNPELKEQSINPIKIGDGKILGIDVKGSVDKLFNFIPNHMASCNPDNKVTSACVVAIVDGIVCSQATITPEDKAVAEAMKTLGLTTETDEEYKCCKGLGIAGAYLANKLNIDMISALAGILK